MRRKKPRRRNMVLSLCDLSGNMVLPWAEAGYQCLCIDPAAEPRQIQISGGGSIEWIALRAENFHAWGLDALHGRLAFACAAPPCTHLAVSGARWFDRKRLGEQQAAVAFFMLCVGLVDGEGCPWFVENPVSIMSTVWRQPDHYFHPWQYADKAQDPDAECYSKKTCLWVGGGFRMPEPGLAPGPIRDDIHKMPASPDRSRKRSVTPQGFARAVFEANAKSLQGALL